MSLEITVRLEAPELAASLDNLAAAIANKPLTAAPTTTTKAKKEKEPAATAPAASATPEPTTQPAPETASTSEFAPATAPEATYTLVQVREKLATLSQAGKQAQVKTLITKMGAAKLSDVPAEKYAELMKEAEALS